MGRYLTWRDLAIIVLFSLSVFFLSFQLRDASCTPLYNFGSDSNLYIDLAQNLLHHRFLRYSPGIGYPGVTLRTTNPDYIHDLVLMPGYPLLLAIAYVVHDSPWTPYVLAYVLFLIMSIVVFLLGNLLYSEKLRPRVLWTSFIVYQMLQPILILQLQAIGQDFAATVFVAMALLALVWLFKSRGPGWRQALLLYAASAGMLFVRSNMAAFLFPLLAGSLWIAWQLENPGRLRILLGAFLVSLLVLGLWGTYLKSLTGRFMLGANQGFGMYINYAYYLLPQADVQSDIAQITHEFQERLKETGSADLAVLGANDSYQQKALDFIRHHHRLAIRTAWYNLKEILIGKDHFWMPRLVALRLAGLPMAQNETDFWTLYKEMGHGWRRHIYDALERICYFIYVLVPLFSLGLMSLYFLKTLFRRFEISEDALPWMIVGLSAVSSLIFLVATGFVVAQARYRLPTAAISYTAFLGVLSLWQTL